MSRMKKLVFMLTLFLPAFAMAQTATLHGNLKDDANQPIGTANVQIKGTNLQAVTDSTGAFEIKNVPYGDATILVGDADRKSVV